MPDNFSAKSKAQLEDETSQQHKLRLKMMRESEKRKKLASQVLESWLEIVPKDGKKGGKIILCRRTGTQNV